MTRRNHIPIAIASCLACQLLVFAPVFAQDSPADSTPPPTSLEEALSSNPIKISVTKNAPAAGLPALNQSLGLNDSVQIALRQNPFLEESLHSWKAAKFHARTALGKLGPSASFNTFFAESNLNQTLFFMPDSPVAAWPMQNVTNKGPILSFIFSGRQPLLTGGRLLGGYRAARAHEQQFQASYNGDRIQTALQVRRAYWESVWQQARITLATDYVKYRQLTVANMTDKVQKGRVPRADLLREQAELARAQAQVNDTFRDYNHALVQLKSVLAINLGSQVTLKDALEYVQVVQDLQYFMEQAATKRPDIAKARAALAEAKAIRMVAASKYSPQVDLYGIGANQTGHTPENPDHTAHGTWGAFVSVVGGITLFDSGQRFNELRAANEDIRRAQAAIKDTEIKVAQDVSDAWIDLDLARKNVDLAQKQVDSAQEDQRVFHLRYEVGKAIALEDFLAAVRLFEARQNKLEAVYKYRLAEAQLLAASGTEL